MMIFGGKKMEAIKKWTDNHKTISHIALFFLFFLIPCVLYWEYYSKGLFLATGDGVQFFSARKLFSENFLSNGNLLLWEKNLAAGVPIRSIANSDIVSIILGFLPMQEYVYAYYIIHLSFGAFFMYLYLRQIGCNSKVAIIIAIAYETSIHVAGLRKGHMGIITAILYLPVILFFIEKYLKTRCFSWLLASSILMALQFTSGHTQMVLYTDIFVFFYLVFGLLDRNDFSLKSILRIGIWILVYLCLIMFSLLPVIEIMRIYSENSISNNSFTNFCSWSIHFIKLAMMAFPEIFNSIVMPYGNMYSSEADIEIYLGTIILLILCWTIFTKRESHYSRFYLVSMGLAFAYSAIAHIPVLREFVYQIPLIGGFRCPARALYIYIFSSFVLTAIGLTHLENASERIHFKVFLIKFLRKIVIIIVTAFFIAITYFVVNDYTLLQVQPYITYGKKTFFMPIVTFLIVIVVLWISEFVGAKKYMSNKVMYTSLLLLCLFSTWNDVSKYTLLAPPNIPTESVYSLNENAKNLKADLKDYKVWDATTSAHQPNYLIANNKNIITEIPSINAYITYNNPRLYMFLNDGNSVGLNASAALISSWSNVEKNVSLQNDLLSMLGVKYILDTSNVITENNKITFFNDEIIILEKDEIIIPSNGTEIVAVSEPVQLKPNCYYRVVYQTEKSSENVKMIYLDLYGGSKYDLPEINKSVIADGQVHEALINSGDTSCATVETQLRFIAITDEEIKIKNLQVYEIESIEIADVYNPYMKDGSTWIYENPNVREVLYVPEKIVILDSFDTLYKNPYGKQLDKINYLETDIGLTTINQDVQISSINFTSNQITANVIAEGDTFVNFSQCYYPGWEAYVDGEKTEVYMVNGLIQGIQVPAGEHEIQFKYDPTSFKIGSAITASTLIIIVLYFIRDRRKAVK